MGGCSRCCCLHVFGPAGSILNVRQNPHSTPLSPTMLPQNGDSLQPELQNHHRSVLEVAVTGQSSACTKAIHTFKMQLNLQVATDDSTLIAPFVLAQGGWGVYTAGLLEELRHTPGEKIRNKLSTSRKRLSVVERLVTCMAQDAGGPPPWQPTTCGHELICQQLQAPSNTTSLVNDTKNQKST